MDAANPSAHPTFASRTPLRIGAVALVARDLDLLSDYYKRLLGLVENDRKPERVRLGAGGVTLLEIEHRPGAKPDDKRTAGLFHTAFLMPTRLDLARWILHVAGNRIQITGASDHGVSEAFYLDDPEGNGIEVYSDRPQDQWQRRHGLIQMGTDPLDVESILRDTRPSEPYGTAPEGLRIGHIHLRVGELESAEKFYRGAIGLDLTFRYRGAAFMSSGGYHHHVGANVWQSDGARMRDPDMTGLAWFSMEAADAETLDAARTKLESAGQAATTTPHGIETSDPWGTRIRIVKA
jgi:catechol 2,3-dioxygenase